ncbi:hypothetical protein [Actinomycetospora soli]|nr:hypothetical protein [Actinomycetospora soli]
MTLAEAARRAAVTFTLGTLLVLGAPAATNGAAWVFAVLVGR